MAQRKPNPTPSNRRRLGVVVADPVEVIASALAQLVDTHPDLADAGHASDPHEALAVIDRARRSRLVTLIGLGFEGPQDAYWLIREVRERHPTHGVLAIGDRAEPAAIGRALFVGADGYLDERSDAAAFLDGVKRAAEGEMVLVGPDIDVFGAIADGMEQPAIVDERLTEREREVLAFAAEGLTAREIAGRLGVRERTVTTHLSKIYGKFGVGNRVAAVREAVRSGLVPAGWSE